MLKLRDSKDIATMPNDSRIEAGPASTHLPRGPAYALTVDPDRTHLRACEAIFREEQIDCVASTSGAEAIEIMRTRGAPAILLTELSLPGTDGFALVEHLRREYLGSATTVMVVSAFGELRTTAARRKSELGIDWVLAKNSGELFLRHAIHQALSRTTQDGPVEVGPVPHQDPERARRVTEHVDDGLPDEDLQAIVADTARTFGVPVALVSLVLPDRQWFKAYFGLGGDLLRQRGTPVDRAFCRHVVDASATLVVPDAMRHPYFRNNALVQAGVLRSYAGAPLITPDGDVLGTLCIIDSKPMSIDARKVEGLEALARRVVGEVQAKLMRSRMPKGLPMLQSALQVLGASLGGVETGVVLIDKDQRLVFSNAVAIRVLALPAVDLTCWKRDDLLRAVAAQTADPDGFLSSLRSPPEGPFVTRVEVEVQRPRHRRIRWIEQPVPAEGGTCQVCLVRDVTPELAQARPHGSASDRTPVLDRDSSSRIILREVACAVKLGVPISFVLLQIEVRSGERRQAVRPVPETVTRAIQRVVSECAIDSDVVAPWGPGELLVALPRATAMQAEAFAARVTKAARSIDCNMDGSVRVLCGVAQLGAEEDLHAALARASTAITRARTPVLS